MGMKIKIFRTIKEFLTNRKIAISLGKNLSENLTVDNGTPQESIVRPILFSVLINYIFVVRKLQQAIGKLEVWALYWGLIFSVSKIKVVYKHQ